MELIDGIGLVPVVMGLFGVAEVLLNTEQVIKRDIINAKITQPLPNKEDWKASVGPVSRGTILGFFLGILPGGGAVVASFASYALEKRLSKTPERFGHGAIEGVAGPESANNAAAGGAFIPLMTLGIPPNVVMALLLGAFVIHGLQPGPLMITQNPGLFWGIVASMSASAAPVPSWSARPRRSPTISRPGSSRPTSTASTSPSPPRPAISRTSPTCWCRS